MATEPPELAGVLPVIQTPFTADGDIDFDALTGELGWVLDQGVNGVTVGMVSEILRMSVVERMQLAEVVCEVTVGAGRTTVIACGAESTRIAEDLAVHAANHGATAVMAAPPATVSPSDDALFGYFSAIIARAGIPLVVQDASGYVGQPLSLALQSRLLEEYGDDVYFKPEAPPIGRRLSALRDCTGGRARIFEGSGGAAIIDSYRRGIVGSMPGSEVCWAVQALWDRLEAGDWEFAYRISGPLVHMLSLVTGLDGYVAAEKHLLAQQRVLPSTLSRGPVEFVLDHETELELTRSFAMLREATDSITGTRSILKSR